MVELSLTPLSGIRFEKTDMSYGVNEVLLASVLGAVVFSFLAAQPLCIVGVTGLQVYVLDLSVSIPLYSPLPMPAMRSNGLLASPATSSGRCSTFISIRVRTYRVCLLDSMLPLSISKRESRF